MIRNQKRRQLTENAVARASRFLRTFRRAASLAAVVTAVALFTGVSVSAAPYNILYFGNSFILGDGSTESVPNMVSDIAVAAGYEAPNSYDQSQQGVDLGYLRSISASAITGSLPPGQKWDYVVLQDFSTLPTHIGDVSQTRANALGLYQDVAANSPDVVPVLFETWARGPGHEYYTGPTPDFPGGPAQMQAEVRDGYLAAAGDINAYVGSPLAQIAAVGDAFEHVNFDERLYDPDMWHGQNLGTLLAAMVMYTSIYGHPTVEQIDLSGILSNLGLTAEDRLFLLQAASISVPEPSALVLLAGAAMCFAFRRRLFPRA